MRKSVSKDSEALHPATLTLQQLIFVTNKMIKVSLPRKSPGDLHDKNPTTTCELSFVTAYVIKLCSKQRFVRSILIAMRAVSCPQNEAVTTNQSVLHDRQKLLVWSPGSYVVAE